jgi:ribonuclease VapC
VIRHDADLVIDPLRRYGKGRRPAGLNFGDWFSYAPAMATDHSLLFKGSDFAGTDVRVAMSNEGGAS